MNEQIDIPAKLYEDEVVRYFADRYHTSTENVVRCFLVQDGTVVPNLLALHVRRCPLYHLSGQEQRR